MGANERQGRAGRRGGASERGLFGPLEEPERPARPERRRRGATVARAPDAGGEPDEVVLHRGSFAHVALNRPVRCEFTYRVPVELEGQVRPGVRVAVPFGRGREVAVVVATDDASTVPPARTKDLAAVLDAEPVVGPDLLELTRWMSGYYLCSWGEALSAVLPAPLKRERGTRQVKLVAAADGVGTAELAALEERFPKQHRILRTLLDVGGAVELPALLKRLNLSGAPAETLARKGLVRFEKVDAQPDDLLATAPVARVRPERLSPEQQTAVDAIGAPLEAGAYRTFLLQGVTGSGKTEVYLRVIERALELGRGAIVLVPEISLTPQTVGWFRSRFGDVAVLHSRMTDAQRLAMWRRVQHREARVVVGARSAVFAPVPDLGVIVVDEEHEPSFKQGNSPRYHGRDVAVMRARKTGAVCILGSATPALESWQNAGLGRYEHLHLRSRVAGGELPAIEVVDLRTEKPEPGMPLLFSRRLRVLLETALARGEQSILFLNRRGFAPVLWCSSCSTPVGCAHCDLTLTYHRRIGRLVCHACCEERVPPKECPACSSPALRYFGLGSERVETALHALYPEARVRRMDSDTMVRREDYEETLDAFGRGEVDVLVGTQMIAKGLDFPNVTVVGIVAADNSLHLPDFRAAERTFQLLCQVAGRAGRGTKPGNIVVQTHTPEHPAIVCAARHDYESFARGENALRAELGYPPHGRLVRIVVEDPEEPRVEEAAARIADDLRGAVEPLGVAILGPAPAPLSQLRGRYRHHLLLKAPLTGEGFVKARSVLARWLDAARPRVTVDVDPMAML